MTTSYKSWKEPNTLGPHDPKVGGDASHGSARVVALMHHHLHFSAISSCAYSEREPVGISSNAFYGVECHDVLRATEQSTEGN